MDFKVRLIPDEYHFPCVGRLNVGALFWITAQLRWEAESTRDYVATYVFDLEGVLIWSEIIDLGLRSDANQMDAREVISAQLVKVGPYEQTDIRVFPFSVEAHGSTFGLIVRKPDPGEPADIYDELGPLVDAMPGWTYMFYPPWDEGQFAS